MKPGFFLQVLIVLYYSITVCPLIWRSDTFECGKVCKQILLIGLPRKNRLQSAEPLQQQGMLYEYVAAGATALLVFFYVRIVRKSPRAVKTTTVAPYFAPRFKGEEQRRVFYGMQSLLSNRCHQCDVQAPLVWHSDHSGACRVYYDHTCPWVACDVCVDNLFEFYGFVVFGFLQSGWVFLGALGRLVSQLRYLRSAVIGHGARVGIQYIIPAAVLSGPSSLYAVLFMSGVAALMIGMQVGFQAYKVFVTLPQGAWASFQNALDGVTGGEVFLGVDESDTAQDEEGTAFPQYRLVKKNALKEEPVFADGEASVELDGRVLKVLDQQKGTAEIKKFPYHCKMGDKIAWMLDYRGQETGQEKDE